MPFETGQRLLLQILATVSAAKLVNPHGIFCTEVPGWISCNGFGSAYPIVRKYLQSLNSQNLCSFSDQTFIVFHWLTRFRIKLFRATERTERIRATERRGSRGPRITTIAWNFCFKNVTMCHRSLTSKILSICGHSLFQDVFAGGRRNCSTRFAVSSHCVACGQSVSDRVQLNV